MSHGNGNAKDEHIQAELGLLRNIEVAIESLGYRLDPQLAPLHTSYVHTGFYPPVKYYLVATLGGVAPEQDAKTHGEDEEKADYVDVGDVVQTRDEGFQLQAMRVSKGTITLIAQNVKAVEDEDEEEGIDTDRDSLELNTVVLQTSADAQQVRKAVEKLLKGIVESHPKFRYFEYLSVETFRDLLLFLDIKSVCTMFLCSRAQARLSKDELLWKNLLLRDAKETSPDPRNEYKTWYLSKQDEQMRRRRTRRRSSGGIFPFFDRFPPPWRGVGRPGGNRGPPRGGGGGGGRSDDDDDDNDFLVRPPDQYDYNRQRLSGELDFLRLPRPRISRPFFEY